ncbi:MAG: thioesterase family protein [Verrucomicrobia bacterium]|nr:thioesterase family protein [Verrucomicrobiota bacterium]
MSRSDSSLQETFSPASICFGCGPANIHGLRIRSFAEADGSVVAQWTPAPHHAAFPGVLNGGIIGTLLDCHCNWAATFHLMQRDALPQPPCTVTASYAIKLQRPTPTDAEVTLTARVVEAGPDRAKVEGSLSSGGQVCATCVGTFVAVKPGHPAYHRW